MAQTYAQIQKQIEQLQRQADALRAEEMKGVIDRIKVAIEHYGLTAAQLGYGSPKSPAVTTVSASAGVAKPRTAGKVKGKARYSDKVGNAWSGMGPKPGWLRTALEAGHHINEFRIGNRAKPRKNLVPLSTAAGTTTAASAAATSTTSGASPRVHYADKAGHSWSGMGPKPGWLNAAIASGKKLSDFAR